jgi:DNA-binding response OmpR family regulator
MIPQLIKPKATRPSKTCVCIVFSEIGFIGNSCDIADWRWDGKRSVCYGFLLHRILNSSSEKRVGPRCYTAGMNILLIEDDQKAARLLARGLEEEGYRVVIAHAAEEVTADSIARCGIAIVDWMMPGKDGVTLCAEWRQAGHLFPILMLTARDAVADRITGLNTGADDYLIKPFVFDELLARVRALMRRAERMRPAALQVAGLLLEPRTRTISHGEVSLDLTPKEYAIMEFFMRSPETIVSRLQLAQQVWHADLIAIDNLMDVHIKNLRRKLDELAVPHLIETVRGRGFRLVPSKSGHD